MPLDVLVVCTANRCRSPLGATLLLRAAAQAKMPLGVTSRGVHAEDRRRVLRTTRMAARDLPELRHHLSQRVHGHELDQADLVLCMERAHVRAIETLRPGTLQRCFTWKEWLALAAERPCGGRAFGEWTAELHAQRNRMALLQLDDRDDVPDPVGRRLGRHQAVRQELEEMAAATVALLAPAYATIGVTVHPAQRSVS